MAAAMHPAEPSAAPKYSCGSVNSNCMWQLTAGDKGDLRPPDRSGSVRLPLTQRITRALLVFKHAPPAEGHLGRRRRELHAALRQLAVCLLNVLAVEEDWGVRELIRNLARRFAGGTPAQDQYGRLGLGRHFDPSLARAVRLVEPHVEAHSRRPEFLRARLVLNRNDDLMNIRNHDSPRLMSGGHGVMPRAPGSRGLKYRSNGTFTRTR